jgi:predicted transcriptional regulator
MIKLIKLPDGEFEVMKVIWENSSPITSRQILDHFSGTKTWKLQTIDSYLRRLLDRGFLRSNKTGKEREYYSNVSREEYLRFETRDFIKQRHSNSLMNLISALFEDEALTDADLNALERWIQERKE